MKRSEFDHAIRAAGSILGESEILVFGSHVDPDVLRERLKLITSITDAVLTAVSSLIDATSHDR